MEVMTGGLKKFRKALNKATGENATKEIKKVKKRAQGTKVNKENMQKALTDLQQQHPVEERATLERAGLISRNPESASGKLDRKVEQGFISKRNSAGSNIASTAGNAIGPIAQRLEDWRSEREDVTNNLIDTNRKPMERNILDRRKAWGVGLNKFGEGRVNALENTFGTPDATKWGGEYKQHKAPAPTGTEDTYKTKRVKKKAM